MEPEDNAVIINEGSLNESNGIKEVWVMISDNIGFKEIKNFEGGKTWLERHKGKLRGINIMEES